MITLQLKYVPACFPLSLPEIKRLLIGLFTLRHTEGVSLPRYECIKGSTEGKRREKNNRQAEIFEVGFFRLLFPP